LWVYVLGRIMVGSAGLNAALYYRRENRAGQAGRAQLTGVLSGVQPAHVHMALPAATVDSTSSDQWQATATGNSA